MWIVRVKDRGRDLVVHEVERADEAHALRRVYAQLGYASEKILVEHLDRERQAAA